jgi:hypothetical protein
VASYPDLRKPSSSVSSSAKKSPAERKAKMGNKIYTKDVLDSTNRDLLKTLPKPEQKAQRTVTFPLPREKK